MDPVLLRVEEAARLLSIGRTKMYDLISQGIIPTIHIGSAVRIPTEALRDFVQVHRGEAREPLPAARW